MSSTNFIEIFFGSGFCLPQKTNSKFSDLGHGLVGPFRDYKKNDLRVLGSEINIDPFQFGAWKLDLQMMYIFVFV